MDLEKFNERKKKIEEEKKLRDELMLIKEEQKEVKDEEMKEQKDADNQAEDREDDVRKEVFKEEKNMEQPVDIDDDKASQKIAEGTPEECPNPLEQDLDDHNSFNQPQSIKYGDDPMLEDPENLDLEADDEGLFYKNNSFD